MPYRPRRRDAGLPPLLLIILWISVMPLPFIPHGTPLA